MDWSKFGAPLAEFASCTGLVAFGLRWDALAVSSAGPHKWGGAGYRCYFELLQFIEGFELLCKSCETEAAVDRRCACFTLSVADTPGHHAFSL